MTLVSRPTVEGAVLAIDPGTRMGWALLGSDGSITHGVHVLPVEPLARKGLRWESLRLFLRTTHRSDPLVAVFYEYSLFQSKKYNDGYAVLDHGGIIAGIQHATYMQGIPSFDVGPGTIKKHITGHGGSDKAGVIRAVKMLGFKVGDDNEADAIALLDLGIWLTAKQQREDRAAV